MTDSDRGRKKAFRLSNRSVQSSPTFATTAQGRYPRRMYGIPQEVTYVPGARLNGGGAKRMDACSSSQLDSGLRSPGLAGRLSTGPHIPSGTSRKKGTNPPAIARIALAAVLGGCGDPTGPWPAPPEKLPLIETITEWSVSEPDLKQRGRFSYDSDRRLTRYDLSLLRPAGELVIYYVLHEYAGDRVVQSNVYARDHDHLRYFESFTHTGRATYSYDDAGRLAQVVELSFGESGVVGTSRTTYRYAPSGRLSTLSQGDDEQRAFTYDRHGNIVREVVTWNGEAGLTYTYEYDKSFNPLAMTPERLNGVILVHALTGMRLSPHNVTSFTTSPSGGPPAARGVATLTLNAEGFPVRRSVTVTNADLPNAPTTIITEFTYGAP